MLMVRSWQSIKSMSCTKRVFWFLVVCFLGNAAQGQNLKGVVSGYSGNQVMLSYFLGDQRFVLDTFEVNKGQFEFDVSSYPPGFYSLIFDREHFFDLYLHERFVSSQFQAHYLNLDSSMKWSGCSENQAFLAFRKKGLELGSLVERGALSPENAGGIFSSWESQWKNEYRGYKIVDFLSSRSPMEGVTADLNSNFRRWSNEYWKNCALSDPAIVRSPFLLRNLEFYFDKVCPPVPDSTVAALEVLFNREIAPSVREILVSKLTVRFESSKIMGMDKAFVYMVDRFYRTGLATWETEESLLKIVRKADELSWNLLGSKAPDFEFLMANGTKKRLKDFHNGQLHVLYFWDATCSHCQKTTPVLKEFYSKYRTKGIEVIAITTEADLTEWTSYIKNNNLDWTNGYDNRFSQETFRHYYYIPTTPLVMLLGGDGTIIAKNVSIEDLDKIVAERLTNNL
jgi:thiol-disulfide isomerase/thioredoxin